MQGYLNLPILKISADSCTNNGMTLLKEDSFMNDKNRQLFEDKRIRTARYEKNRPLFGGKRIRTAWNEKNKMRFLYDF